MVAGPGFEPGMLRAYETGVVAALPAILFIQLIPCSSAFRIIASVQTHRAGLPCVETSKACYLEYLSS